MARRLNTDVHMLARVLYAAVMLSLLGSLPRTGADRARIGSRRSERAPTEAPASATTPSWTPRPLPEHYCSAEEPADIGRAPDFAVPRIDR